MYSIFNEFYSFCYSNIIKIIMSMVIAIIINMMYKFWRTEKVFMDIDHMVLNREHQRSEPKYKPDELLTPYPNSWYPIILSADLVPGKVMPYYIFEKEIVAFRTHSGKVHVMDAYCLHQGANLGVGGSVVGEDIRCPFHSWQFNGGGVCTNVPGLEGTNLPKAKIKVWDSIERNNWIYIWYHEQGDTPTWQPSILDGFENKIFCGQNEFYMYNCIMDIYANVFDPVHLEQIHSMCGIVSDEQLLTRGFWYHFIKKIIKLHMEFEFRWGEGNDKRKIFIESTVIPILFGYPLEFLKTSGKMIFCPLMIYAENTVSLFKIKYYTTYIHLPISPLKWKVKISVYHAKSNFFSKLAAKVHGKMNFKMVYSELFILNNKRFLKNMCLTKLDKNQARFIRWFNEYYFKLN